MNVAIYLRKSREEEAETREETLARHERILTDYCERHGLTVIKKYKEVVSGESIANRPKMQALLNDVSSGLYDGVVVVELERLSRGNQIDQAEILEILKKSCTKIYTLNKVYELSSDNDFDEDFFEFGLFMSRSKLYQRSASAYMTMSYTLRTTRCDCPVWRRFCRQVDNENV